MITSVPTAVLAFERAALAAGRNEGPLLLADWLCSGRLTVDELRPVIGEVWTEAEWPAASLGQRVWVSLFQAAGFVTDDEDERPLPTEPLTVYRGTTWGRRRGMSWTESRGQAEWFANRWKVPGTGSGLVFEARVEPAAILARFGQKGGRNEQEVVVDPVMLPPIGQRCVLRSFG